jgi:hypothetical protein
VGSIPEDVTGIFLHNPSGCTMALGLTQPLKEMSTRNISWGENGANADCLEILEPQLSGTLRACSGLQWDCFYLLSFCQLQRK